MRNVQIKASLASRFWKKVVVSADEDDCWGWIGCTVKKYGYIQKVQNGEGRIYAHRVSWVLHNGPIPDGMWVLHKCDNQPCCNPRHLFVGTPKDNGADMSIKGRSKAPKGDDCVRRKLDSGQVAEIRLRHAAGETRKSLAQEFGVCVPHVCDIVNRRTWRHLYS
jgi:HNH endonuclease